jgi:pyruvate formate lyase activating enzyme
MLAVNKEKCNGDGVCTMICPMEAITLGEDGKAHIDTDQCVECLACQAGCPQEAIEEYP